MKFFDQASLGPVVAASGQYALGPFRFDSEIFLPELRGAVEGELRPVRIRLGEVPRGLAGGVAVDAFCTVSATEYLLEIPEVARFYAGGGSEVRVEPVYGAAAADVRLYLLGSVFGALCHQNGYLPLHASAVESKGRVTAFLGQSGAGKSTLAAFLGRRGYRVVSDDICLLDATDDGGFRVIPVAGWLKLWRASLDVLGEEPREENRLLSRDDKFRVYLGQDSDAVLELRQLVFLERPADALADMQPTLQARGSAAAMAGLMQLTYLNYLPEANGEQARFFARCGAVLNQARAYRLVAPLGFEHMEGVLDLIERTLLSQVAST